MSERQEQSERGRLIFEVTPRRHIILRAYPEQSLTPEELSHWLTRVCAQLLSGAAVRVFGQRWTVEANLAGVHCLNWLNWDEELERRLIDAGWRRAAQ